jgi:hypothetical protein
MIYIGLHHYFILVFFKWINNQEGTAGYVMVSATNERDVKLVQNIESIKIKYQPQAYFQSNLERFLYFSGYSTWV